MAKNKRIAYSYLFNYFGCDEYNGRTVNGSGITLNIRPYKNGREVLFEKDDEVSTNGRYLSDVFNVSFDRQNQFIIKKNLQMDNLFRLVFGWERIEASVIEYELDVICGTVGDEKNDLPENFHNIPVSEPVVVSKEEYRKFLISHADDFDISDNRCAQVPSVMFYGVPDNDMK